MQLVANKCRYSLNIVAKGLCYLKCAESRGMAGNFLEPTPLALSPRQQYSPLRCHGDRYEQRDIEHAELSVGVHRDEDIFRLDSTPEKNNSVNHNSRTTSNQPIFCPLRAPVSIQLVNSILKQLAVRHLLSWILVGSVRSICIE